MFWGIEYIESNTETKGVAIAIKERIDKVAYLLDKDFVAPDELFMLQGMKMAYEEVLRNVVGITFGDNIKEEKL